MFEFTKKFAVDDKLAFRFSSDPADESYTLLVKKIKDNLVAAVVSNNDKNRINPNTGDEIYLFSGLPGEKWVTKTLLMQKQSYPLIILSVAEEPWPLAPELKKEAPAPEHEIESVETAFVQSIAGGGEEMAAVSLEDEKEGVESEDLTSMAGITIRELRAEPERMEEEEGVRLGAEDLDELPEIDTSELEAELDADIEDTLEKERGQFAPSWTEAGAAAEEPVSIDESHLPAEDEELAGMVMAKESRLELDSFDEEEEAALVTRKPEGPMEPEEPEMLDMIVAEEPLAGRETLEEEAFYVPREVEQGEIALETTGFHDFFTAYLTPAGEAPEKAAQAAYVPAGMERVVESLTERIERLEKALASISGEPSAQAPLPRRGRTAVILAGLSEDGFRAVMEEAPLSGETFTVEIERPWRPPLYLKTGACAESSFEVNGVTLTKFRFTALDEKDAAAVRAYLDGRKGFYRSLTELVKD